MEERAGETEPVTITLDTVAPELTIDNPKNGDKTNKETVTVEGTVSDANLDSVKVNGQTARCKWESTQNVFFLDTGITKLLLLLQI